MKRWSFVYVALGICVLGRAHASELDLDPVKISCEQIFFDENSENKVSRVLGVSNVKVTISGACADGTDLVVQSEFVEYDVEDKKLYFRGDCTVMSKDLQLKYTFPKGDVFREIKGVWVIEYSVESRKLKVSTSLLQRYYWRFLRKGELETTKSGP